MCEKFVFGALTNALGSENASPCRRAPVESNANWTCGQRRVETTPRGGTCGRAPVETNVNTGCRRAPVETNVNAGSCRRPPVETNVNAGPSPRESVEKKVPEGNAESGINWGKMLALLGGGAMVGYLAYRAHDMYRNSQQPSVCPRSTAVTSSRDLGRSRNLECVFCCQTDELETKVKLTCGHSIHKKCLKYMYVYFQMENLGRPRCALEDCNSVVSSNLLEEIEVWVAMDME